MPSWKKVIVSGSDAALNSLYAPSITGSLLGTASWAQNSVTASFTPNALTTASVSSNTITFTKGDGSTFPITVDTGSGGSGVSDFPYTGSARITGSLVITGSIFVTQSHISTIDYIDFTVLPTPPAFNTGRLHWTDDTKTLQLDTDVNGFELEIGHQSILRGRNVNSFTLTKGLVVYIDGESGNRPTFATASWEGDPSSATTIGIVAEDINSAQTGYAVTNGLIRGIDTNAFAPGTSLYLSASGQYTSTPPTAPLHNVRLGKTITQATSGIVYVDIDNGYELAELHDVKDTTTSASYGDLLVKSGSIWVNSKQLTGSYGLTGSLTATSFTGSLFGTASYATQALSSSFATTASYVLNAVSSSFATLAQTANTASYVLNAVSASFATTAQTAQTASYILNAVSASFASTASFTPNALTTASVSSNTITFTKGDGTTFPITVDTGSGGAAFPFTGSAGITGSLIVTGSINSRLTVNNNLGFRQAETASYNLGTQNVGGTYRAVNFTGSVVHTTYNGSTDSRIGVSSGNSVIPSIAATIPSEIVGFTSETGSNYSSVFAQRIDTTAIGGGPTLQSGLLSIFNNNEQYDVRTDSSNRSLSIRKFDTAGRSIQLVLQGSETGFNLSNNLTSPSASLFKINNSASNIIFETFQTGLTQVNGSFIATGSNGTINTDTSNLLSSGILSVDWSNRQLFDNSGLLVSLSWRTRNLVDSNESSSLSWNTRQLNNAASTPTVDWNNNILYDSNAVDSVNWDNRNLVDSNFKTSTDWRTRRLFDSNESSSLAWNARQLNNTSGNTVLTWLNGIEITKSTVITGSLTVTAGITGSLNGTASFATTASHALNGGVTQLIAGTNISLSPAGGTGAVTINSTGGGPGGDTTAVEAQLWFLM